MNEMKKISNKEKIEDIIEDIFLQLLLRDVD
jgi:hypothetical protein